VAISSFSAALYLAVASAASYEYIAASLSPNLPALATAALLISVSLRSLVAFSYAFDATVAYCSSLNPILIFNLAENSFLKVRKRLLMESIAARPVAPKAPNTVLPVFKEAVNTFKA
jgi:hypothetical protein